MQPIIFTLCLTLGPVLVTVSCSERSCCVFIPAPSEGAAGVLCSLRGTNASLRVWCQCPSSSSACAGAGPFWVTVLREAVPEGWVFVTGSHSWCSWGKVQRSDLAADVLSWITGERRQSRALSSGLFPEQSPKDEDGFFQTPSFT